MNTLRFNESPIDLPARATEAGVAEGAVPQWNDWSTWSIARALRIPDFTMSTVSKAH